MNPDDLLSTKAGTNLILALDAVSYPFPLLKRGELPSVTLVDCLLPGIAQRT